MAMLMNCRLPFYSLVTIIISDVKKIDDMVVGKGVHLVARLLQRKYIWLSTTPTKG
jgi:hypothetical protein